MKNENGFSLIELLIVVVILGVISTITIIGIIAVKQSTQNSLQVVRLQEFVEVQNQFRTVLGRRRFATIEELCSESLLSDNLIRFTGKCNSLQEAINGRVIEQPNESTIFLKSHFFAVIKIENRSAGDTSSIYCVGDDGVLRKSLPAAVDECTGNSPPVE